MKRKNLKNIPIGVLFIASFYVFGAFMGVIGVFTNPSAVRKTIAMAHGLLPIVDVEIVLMIAVLTLVLAYGLIRLSRWGFILTVSYSIYICLVNLIRGCLDFTWTAQPEKQISFGNFLFSTLVIIYLLIERKHFFVARSGNDRP